MVFGFRVQVSTGIKIKPRSAVLSGCHIFSGITDFPIGIFLILVGDTQDIIEV
jgi:hypothetical protein